MIVIQLSDEQVAEIANRVSGGKRSGRENKPRKHEPAVGDLMRGTDLMTVGKALARRERLVATILADLRALQVAARTASRREVEGRVVMIIDGIENTLAEE